jgi:hypothetical protein
VGNDAPQTLQFEPRFLVADQLKRSRQRINKNEWLGHGGSHW